MPKIKLQIVEDNFIIAHNLKELFEGLGYEVCKITATATEAMEVFRAETPDIALMDIYLKGKEYNADGIEAAINMQAIRETPVIFLTDLRDKEIIENAKKAYPSAYLNKPIEEKQLNLAIELALHNFSQGLQKNAILENQKDLAANAHYILKDAIFLKDPKDKDRFVKILFDNILYIEAAGNYVDIHTTHKKYTHITKFNELVERLPRPLFFQVHRSFAVNIKKVESFHAKDKQLYILEKNIPISQPNWDEFLRRFTNI